MVTFEELKSYVGFGAPDAAALAKLGPVVEPDLPSIAETFYAAARTSPRAMRVFQDDAQIARLKLTLQQWMRTLLAGPHDEVYFKERLRIGQAHVRVGLAQEYMFTAMGILRAELCARAIAAFDRDEATAVVCALGRILDVELAIMVGAYTEEHERQSLVDLRELIVSHLPSSVLVLDQYNRVVAHTPAANILWGDVDMVGENIDGVLPPPITAALSTTGALAAHADGRDAKLNHHEADVSDTVLPRIDLYNDDGELRSFRVTVVRLEHHLATTLISIEDLTDIISAESRAQRSERLAQVGTMATQVAHEVRNPLAGISGTMQVLIGSLPPDDKRVQVLGKVLDQIKRLDLFVNDLLAFARPVVARCEDIELRPLALDVAAQVEAAGDGSTTVDGAGRAHADMALTQQVLINVVQNAWQAGAENVVVKIEGRRILILDDGPGLPAELRDKVFAPFFTTRSKGTGLGLSFAQMAVEAQGGEVNVVRSPLGGAGFAVLLPPAVHE